MAEYKWQEQAFLKDLGGLLRIPATNGDSGEVTDQMPLGKGIYDAIAYVLDKGRELGFRTKMLDGYCGWVEAGEQGADKMIGVLGHVDTVPVEQEGWKGAPFDATVIDGKVYGRGVCDDKGPTLLALYAMKALEEAGGIRNKRVRLIVGGDEESGAWTCMERYRRTEELPTCAFSPDAAYPAIYAEKGIVHVTISRTFGPDCLPILVEAGDSYNIVPAKARAVLDGVEYRAEGKAAHASRPDLGVNALKVLAQQMKDKGISHPVVELLSMGDAKGLGADFRDEPSGELTLNPAIVEATGEAIALKCDLRIPVTVSPEAVVEAINNKVSPLGLQAVFDFYKEPLYVEKDSPLVTTLQQVYTQYTGRTDAPLSMGGGTYARAFDNAVAFGPLFPDEEDTNHKTNECWSLASIEKNFQILCNVLEQL